jgi:hypothetical protein
VPAVIGLVDHRGHAHHARVVDEDVEVAEAFLGRLQRGAPVPGVGDVERQEVGVVARGSQVARVPLAEVVEDVREQDGGALLGEPAAVRGALSAGAAGDEGGLAREPMAHPWTAR